MTAAEFFSSNLAGFPVIAIFRDQPVEQTVQLCETAWRAGVTLVEVPVRAPGAWAAFDAAVAAGKAAGRRVGAGTVVDPDQLEEVVRRGGDFAVSPGFHPDVVERALRLGIPLLPGVATASEVSAAVRTGHTWLKAFPARELGETWAAAIKGPFPEVALVATGGISAGNAAAFLRSGYDAVAVGSAFGTPKGVTELALALRGRESQ